MPIETRWQQPFIEYHGQGFMARRPVFDMPPRLHACEGIELIERTKVRRRFRTGRPGEVVDFYTAQSLLALGENAVELEPEVMRSYAIRRFGGTELAIGKAQHDELSAQTEQTTVSIDGSTRRRLTDAAVLPGWLSSALARL